MNKYLIFIISFFLFATFLSFGQGISNHVDTLMIFKNKSGVGYSKYEHEWFMKRGNWSYRPNKMTKQDSLVLLDTTSQYYKVYDYKNRILMEGFKSPSASFIGDVKHYKTNGDIFKIEKWNVGKCIDTLGEKFCESDSPTILKTTYLNKDGTIKKSTFYTVKIKNKTPLEFFFVKKTIRN